MRWGEKGQIYNFLTLILSDRVKLFTLLLGILKNSTDHETRRSSTKYNKDEGKERQVSERTKENRDQEPQGQ